LGVGDLCAFAPGARRNAAIT